MIPKIGITEKELSNSKQILAVVLADAVVLYTKLRKFHWNVSGNSFMELHKLFEANYTELELIIDNTAERISELGGKTIGTMTEFLAITNLKENPNYYPTQTEMISELVTDYEQIIVVIREAVAKCSTGTDYGTVDFLTSLLETHEKSAWILRRYLS